jgi:hypothetical protein
MPITWSDWLHLVIAFSVILGWFRENYLSDMDHFTGKAPVMEKLDSTRHDFHYTNEQHL